MKYFSSKKFDKQFTKLPEKIKNQYIERIQIFVQDPNDIILNNHSVHYLYEGCRSINISGDVRALYEMVDDTALFVRIGTHSELYK